MKKLMLLKNNWYEGLQAACLCSGFLLLLCFIEDYVWFAPVLLPVSLFCIFLLHWSEEKKLWVPIGGGIILSAVLIGLFLRRMDMDLALYFAYLGLAGVGLPIGAACYFSRRRLWLRGLFLLIQMGSLIYFSMDGVIFPEWVVCIILFNLLLILSETAQIKSTGIGKQYVQRLMPVFLIIPVLLCFFPVRSEPIRWTAVRNVIEAAKEQILVLVTEVEALFSGEDAGYSLSFTGFDGEGSLGGDIASADTSQISLKGGKTKSPVYLAGSIKDVYNGHGWENSKKEKPYKEEEYLLNYKQLQSALSQSIYTMKEVNQLTASSSFRLEYENIKTKSLFHMLNTNKLYFDRLPRMDTSKDAIRMKRMQKKRFQYSIFYMEADYGSSKMQKLLRQQAWKGEPERDPMMDAREAYIHQEYTALPEELPERVYDLEEEITEGKDTDYERLKAIEAYLSIYPYTQSPGEVPKDQDFTDYFLFDGKEGYCTYFATALAVLGRCAGIPTRYVEGFVTKETMNYENRKIMISSNDAHAWAEAYIDHIGWVPFDPTPDYYVSGNSSWKLPEVHPNSGINQERRPEPTPTPAPDIVPEEKEPPSAFLGKRLLHLLPYGIAFILLLTALLVSLALLRNLLSRKRYQKKDLNQKMKLQMEKVLLLGRMYGFEWVKGDTLAAYGKRANEKSLLDSSFTSYDSICRLYQEIRFGGRPVSEDNIQVMEKYVTDIEKRYLANCGRWKRFMYYW